MRDERSTLHRYWMLVYSEDIKQCFRRLWQIHISAHRDWQGFFQIQLDHLDEDSFDLLLRNALTLDLMGHGIREFNDERLTCCPPEFGCLFAHAVFIITVFNASGY
jgi:hypothetical protein